MARIELMSTIPNSNEPSRDLVQQHIEGLDQGNK